MRGPRERCEKGTDGEVMDRFALRGVGRGGGAGERVEKEGSGEVMKDERRKARRASITTRQTCTTKQNTILQTYMTITTCITMPNKGYCTV